MKPAGPSTPAFALAALAAIGSASVAQGDPIPITPPQELSLPEREVEEDWHWWWHFNKDAYLRLRERVFEEAPTTGGRDFFMGIGEVIRKRDPSKLSAYELRVQIVPSILTILEEQTDAPLLAECLMALAKIGPEGELDDLDPFDQVFVDHLDHSDKAVRERAVVALGIFGRTDSVPVLADLLKDTRAGQRLVGVTEVQREMRAFAAYSLGLIGHRTDDQGMRREIVSILTEVLDGPKFATRDIKTGCMVALGVVALDPEEYTKPPRWTGGPKPDPPDPLSGRIGQLRYLLKYFGDFRHHHEFIRCHAANAMARLIEAEPPVDERVVEEVKKALVRAIRKHGNEPDAIQQSAIIALGELCDTDKDKVDRDAIKSLMWTTDKGERYMRRMSLMALGRIASHDGRGKEPGSSRTAILKFLDRQMGVLGESRLAAWCALSLGVMMRDVGDRGALPPQEPLEDMRKALEDCRTPLDIGAYALSLGLIRDRDSSATLLEKLELFNVPNPKGLVALSLGLTGPEAVREELRQALRDAGVIGEIVELVAIGLALLGDDDRVPILEELLEEAGSEASRTPLVAALGRTGDRRVIQTLVEILQQGDEATNGLLTSAVVALGNVADKDKLLWRSIFSANSNYVIAPPTYRGGGGILDLF